MTRKFMDRLKRSKAFNLFLALMLTVSTLPVQAFAAESADVQSRMSGTCYVQCVRSAWDGGTLFNLTMPDGQVIQGYCLNPGWPTPVDGKNDDMREQDPMQEDVKAAEEKGKTASTRLRFAVKVAAVVAAILAVGYIGVGMGLLAHDAVPGSGKADDAGQMEAVSGEAAACDHLWVPQYGSVHHDAVYEQVWHEPVYGTETTYHTVCNTCNALIDGNAAQHIEETGHSGYSTDVPIVNEVVVQSGYYEQVLVKEAWDETVQTGSVCASCGEEKPLEGGAA